MSKIIGNTTATPNPRPDWAQTDETKADYIKNKDIVYDALDGKLDRAEEVVDASISQEKVVPGGSIGYANVTEIGGMTYRVEETTSGGNILAGPYTFTVGGGYLSGAYGVVVPKEEYPGNEAGCIVNYAVYLKNTGTEPIMVQLNASASTWIQYITLPADGQFHLYTGTSTFYKFYYDFIIDIYTTVVEEVPVNVEASTITFYEEGGAPVVNNVLKNAAVTEIESAGANLFGGNSEANPQYIGHYYCDPNGSFFAKSDYNAFLIPVEGNTAYYVWGSSNTLITRGVFHFLDSDKTLISVDSSLSDEKEGSFTTPANTAFIRFATSISSAATIDIMINKGTAAIPYVPYREPSILLIPEEVQSLDGWGMGVSDLFYNRLIWEPETNTKKFRKAVKKLVLTGAETFYAASGENKYNLILGDLMPSLNHYQGAQYVCNAYTAVNYGGRADKTVCMYSGANGNIVQFQDSDFSTVDAFKVHLSELYAAGKPVEIVYPLVSYSVATTDLTNILGDNFIEVESGGTITAINENNFDVPYTINYYTTNDVDAIHAGKFVGDFFGKFVGDVSVSETPENADSATSKKYVDDLAATKLDKTTTRLNTYITDGNGLNKTVQYSSGPYAFTMMYRYDDGRVQVGEPVNNTDAATKNYVDTAVASAGGGDYETAIITKVGTVGDSCLLEMSDLPDIVPGTQITIYAAISFDGIVDPPPLATLRIGNNNLAFATAQYLGIPYFTNDQTQAIITVFNDGVNFLTQSTAAPTQSSSNIISGAFIDIGVADGTGGQTTLTVTYIKHK